MNGPAPNLLLVHNPLRLVITPLWIYQRLSWTIEVQLGTFPNPTKPQIVVSNPRLQEGSDPFHVTGAVANQILSFKLLLPLISSQWTQPSS